MIIEEGLDWSQSAIDTKSLDGSIHGEKPVRWWKFIIINDADEVSASEPKGTIPGNGYRVYFT
jgi:hypothetical protein